MSYRLSIRKGWLQYESNWMCFFQVMRKRTSFGLRF